MRSSSYLIMAMGIAALLQLVPMVAFGQQATSGDKVSAGVSYSNMGDFGDNWGMRVQWGRGDWFLTGGWNKVDATVAGAGGQKMGVNGSLWQLDASYILKSHRDKAGELSGLFYGLGAGLRSIDADWNLSGITQGAKKVAGTGHAFAGAKWGNIFADVRYEWGGKLFGYKADGVQFMLGATWPVESLYLK